MTKDVFMNFLKEYVTTYNIDLKKEPPQASIFGWGLIEDREVLALSYPHLLLDEVPQESWSTLIRIHMKETPSCEGAVFWCVAEDTEDEKKSQHLIFFIYRKENDELLTYKSDLFLTTAEEVTLEETLPFLIDDYGIEIIIH